MFIITNDDVPQIAAYMQDQPDGFRPLFDEGVFADIHAVPAGVDPDPAAPRRNICRSCATEVFLYGLRDWWLRERSKAISNGSLIAKPDCPFGKDCIDLNEPCMYTTYFGNTALNRILLFSSSRKGM